MSIEPGAGPPGAPAPPGEREGDDSITRTQRIDALAAYFRANAGTYTSEALRRAAADAGYDPRDIAAATAVAAEPPAARGTESVNPALVTIGFVVGTYVVVFVLGVIPDTSGLAAPAAILALVLGILGWIRLRDTRPAVANAFRVGVIIAIVIPVVIMLVALGVCVVAIVGLGR